MCWWLLHLLPLRSQSINGTYYAFFARRNVTLKFDTQKIEAAQNYHIPTFLSDFKSFLGFTGYYRRFVEGSHLIHPLWQIWFRKKSFNGLKLMRKAFGNCKLGWLLPSVELTRRYAMFLLCILILLELDWVVHSCRMEML